MTPYPYLQEAVPLGGREEEHASTNMLAST